MQTLSTIISYLGILLWGFGLYLVAFSSLRGLLGRAVKMMWQKKYLLLLAFFAGLPAYGGEVNFLYRKLNTVAALQGYLTGIRDAILGGQVDQFFSASKTLLVNNFGIMSAYFGIAILVFAVIAWLIIMSQAAVIRIIGRLRQGKPTSLVDALTIGIEKFWQLVQLNIIGILVGWATWVLLTAVPAAIYLINHHAAWSVVAYAGSLLSIVFSIITIFLVQFATASIVLNGTSLMAAMVDSWRLFTRNVVSSMEMAIAIFTVNITVSSLVTGELFFFVSPFTLPGFLFIVAVIVLLYTLLSAFSFCAWTMFYMQLSEGKSESKLGEWTNRLANFSGQKRITN